MAILIKDMEIPDSCFLCRFCRRQEYGEYFGEDTAWSCVASKKRITDGRDLIVTFKHPDCPLVEVPDEQPDRNAQERYEDLCEYFKDCSDKGMGILGDRKEFKAWLERLHWHVVRCDELGRELEKLQSAQPEKRTDKRTETHACDSVNRQAAIDAVRHAWAKGLEPTQYLEELPSAQPEPLTDKEQRIFLAAMGREEDVCKQVDAEYRDCREPYEDSLVRTCHEIIRKVKCVLWT